MLSTGQGIGSPEEATEAAHEAGFAARGVLSREDGACGSGSGIRVAQINMVLNLCGFGLLFHLVVFERPPPKVAPVGVTPGGVLLRENRMYG